MKNKSVYSLNMAAYLIYRGYNEFMIAEDEKGLYFLVFDEDVSEAIREYRTGKCTVELHKYLECYKKLRQRINSIRVNCI